MTLTDDIQEQLFARDTPVLEPGSTVYDPSLVKQIASLKEHRYVIAGGLLAVV